MVVLGMKNIAKFVTPKRRALILATSMLKGLVFLNSLLAKYYHDIDIENCHPRITKQLAKSLGLPCASISDYIINHKTWFKEINEVHGYDCNKAKTLMLRFLYLGDYYEVKKIKHVEKYAKELLDIAKRLWNDANDKTIKLVKKEVKRKNKNNIEKNSKATLMSWHIQSIECGILLKVYEWFTDNDYKVGQFCHDGLTIERNESCPFPNLLPEDVIDEVNKAINEIGGPYNYENYTVTLSEKPMPIKDLGNIIVDPNVLPTYDEEKEEPAKLDKSKKGLYNI